MTRRSTTLIAMTRIGIDAFWAAPNPKVPQVSVLEIAPVGALLALCIALTVLGNLEGVKISRERLDCN